MFKNLWGKILGKMKKPFNLFIQDLDGGQKNLSKRCLLYYKTDPFYRDLESLKIFHTNNQEIILMVNALNEMGYVVDVVDREHKNFTPKNIYDLFIGCASGNSGKDYLKIATKLRKAIKILYCVSPEPSISNSLVKERYDDLSLRKDIKIDYMRMSKIPFDEFVKASDSIFLFGEKNQFCDKSYRDKYDLPIFNIVPSINKNVFFKDEWLISRNKKKYLCFAGSGAICKGVDILIEAFESFPQLELHICSPEDDDMKVIKSLYKKNFKKNIFYHGFVKPGSSKFISLVNQCSFSILNSAAEGCCTSILTSMKSGLVPIVNHECGIKLFSDLLKINSNKNRVQSTIEAIKIIMNTEEDTYQEYVKNTLIESNKYSEDSFHISFKESLKLFLE